MFPHTPCPKNLWVTSYTSLDNGRDPDSSVPFFTSGLEVSLTHPSPLTVLNGTLYTTDGTPSPPLPLPDKDRPSHKIITVTNLNRHLPLLFFNHLKINRKNNENLIDVRYIGNNKRWTSSGKNEYVIYLPITVGCIWIFSRSTSRSELQEVEEARTHTEGDRHESSSVFRSPGWLQ